jgi:iron complex transport system substrate-binding protein
MSIARSAQRRFAALAVGVALIAAACSSSDGAVKTTTAVPPADQVFVGADGVSTIVADTSRIVSLTGDITEIIFELGMGESVVAVDITTTYPPEAEALKASGSSVGFGQALSAEAVLRYEPTLVLGDESIQPTATIEQLRDAGVPVIILKYQTTLPGVEEKITEIADILGAQDAGEDLSEQVMSQVAAAQSRAARSPDRPRVAYLYTRGPSVLLLFGDGMPTQAMIEGAGAIDVGASAGEGAIRLTPEALIASAPDVIVLPESGIEGLGGIDALLEIPGIADTPAGQDRMFLAYDEAYFFNLGPRVGAALSDFVDDLYPDVVD